MLLKSIFKLAYQSLQIRSHLCQFVGRTLSLANPLRGVFGGLIARKLASYNENLVPEKFFVAGMLHDIGQIVLCTKLPELTLKILREIESQPKPLRFAEIEELGFDHAGLG